ncbi:hypothetical protein, partial [Xanthomonas hortorum]|uniref:hypothetical protein n=1 Tax=Xanthomonas hortorum TaxID=56454 RepID=UPI0019D3E7B1
VVAAVYGPWYTNNELATPMPSRTTVAEIEKMADADVRVLSLKYGDKIIMCNNNVCITYTSTQSDGWLGGPATQQIRYPNLPDGPRYDNGDVRQGTGGSNSGGRSQGGGGSRGGSTEVRPIQPV